MRRLLAAADGHVPVPLESGDQSRDVGRVVLAICIEEDENASPRRPRARLDGCAVTKAVWVADHLRTEALGDGGRSVGGAVVHDDYLCVDRFLELPKEMLQRL